ASRSGRWRRRSRRSSTPPTSWRARWCASSWTRRKPPDERLVGRQNHVIAEARRLDEREVAHLDRPRCHAGLAAVDQHQEMEFGIAMEQHVEDRPDGDLDAELFLYFAAQGFVGRFAGLDLAAGKLPVERHRLVFATLGEQNAAGGVAD